MACVLLLAGCDGLFNGEDATQWTIRGEPALWSQYDMPKTSSTEAVIARFHYDVRKERFYIEAQIYPANRWITVEDVTSAETRFYLVDTDQVTIREAPGAGPGLVLSPRSGTPFSSSLVRNIGDLTLEQPFGNLTLTVAISEVSYELERKSGFPNYGGDFTEQVGDGVIRLNLKGASGESLFSLEEEYIENSDDYATYFSPDGRYLLVTLPNEAGRSAAYLPGHHRFILVGSLSIDRDHEEVQAEIARKNDEDAKQREIDRRRQSYLDDEISAAIYYGEVFISAEKKALTCDDIERRIGKIESLTLQPRVMKFGNPVTVGKVFTFDYVSAQSRGKLQVISLDPEHAETAQAEYRPYTDSIDIRSDGDVQYANCP